MYGGGIGGVHIALNSEQEVRRNQHGLNGKLNSLLHRLPFGLGHADKFHKPCRVSLCHWTSICPVREFGNNLLNTSIACLGITDQNLLAAGFFNFGRIGTKEPNHVGKFVLLVTEGIFLIQGLDEVVINETCTKNVIAFRKIQLEFFFRVRIEGNHLRGPCFHIHHVEQLSVHPKTHLHRLGIGCALPWQTNPNCIFAVKIHAVRRLYIAAIQPADVRVFTGVLRKQGFGKWISTNSTCGDSFCRHQVLFHQDRRNG